MRGTLGHFRSLSDTAKIFLIPFVKNSCDGVTAIGVSSKNVTVTLRKHVSSCATILNFKSRVLHLKTLRVLLVDCYSSYLI